MKNDYQWNKRHPSGRSPGVLRASNKRESFIGSIDYAWRGLVCVLRSEANFRIQLMAAGLVFMLAWILKLSLGRVSILVMTVTFVLVMEIVNTVVESLADVAHPNQHEEVRKLKDMMAGAVMLSSVSAVVVGLLIFIPSIVSLLV